jgi:CubicO group peptidase (beta-lactamase class C family)
MSLKEYNMFHSVYKILIVALILSLIRVQPAAAAGNGPDDPAEMQAFIAGVMAAEMKDNHIPGAVVTVVKDGKLLFAEGYGYADLEKHGAVDPERTLFRPGSVSKLFVWTAVMQLVEQGKLALDADVNTYLDFTIPATYPQPITLKNLLTHTSGFEDKGEGLFILDPEKMISLGQYLKSNIPARVFPPGQLGAYSNYGCALAAYVVERVAGLPFSEYVEKNIFAPLGMTHSTFRQPLPPQLAADMAGGYNYSQGEFMQGSFEFIPAYPAGALSASATDIAKFMLAHLQNGQSGGARILAESTAKQMHSSLFSHDSRLTGMAYGFFEDTLNGQRVISHGGDTLLFHSGLFLLPDRNIGLFVSTNGVGGAGVSARLFKLFMERYYPLQPQPAPQPAPGFAQRIAPYLGEYYPARSNTTTLEKFLRLMQPAQISLNGDGRLLVSAGGQISQMVEIEPGLLQSLNDPDNRMALRADENGTYLLPTMPMAFIKTPWYGTAAFQGLLVMVGLLFFFCTTLAWGLSFLSGLRKREPRPLMARLARLVGVSFGLVFVAFLIGFMVIFMDIDPAFGVPRLFFGRPPSMEFVMTLPRIAAGLSAALLLFCALAWVKRYWNVAGRVHYSLLALTGVALVWVLYYWNFLI